MSLYPGVCVPAATSARRRRRGCPPRHALRGARRRQPSPRARRRRHRAAGHDRHALLLERRRAARARVPRRRSSTSRPLDVHGIPLGARQRRDLLLARHASASRSAARRRAAASASRSRSRSRTSAPAIACPPASARSARSGSQLTVTDARGARRLRGRPRRPRRRGPARQDLRPRQHRRRHRIDVHGRPLGVFGADVVDGPDVPRWIRRRSLGGTTLPRRAASSTSRTASSAACAASATIDARRRVPARPRARSARAPIASTTATTTSTPASAARTCAAATRFFETYFPVGALDATAASPRRPTRSSTRARSPPGAPLRYTYELDAGGAAGPFTRRGAPALPRLPAVPPARLRRLRARSRRAAACARAARSFDARRARAPRRRSSSRDGRAAVDPVIERGRRPPSFDAAGPARARRARAPRIDAAGALRRRWRRRRRLPRRRRRRVVLRGRRRRGRAARGPARRRAGRARSAIARGGRLVRRGGDARPASARRVTATAIAAEPRSPRSRSRVFRRATGARRRRAPPSAERRYLRRARHARPAAPPAPSPATSPADDIDDPARRACASSARARRAPLRAGERAGAALPRRRRPGAAPARGRRATLASAPTWRAATSSATRRRWPARRAPPPRSPPATAWCAVVPRDVAPHARRTATRACSPRLRRVADGAASDAQRAVVGRPPRARPSTSSAISTGMQVARSLLVIDQDTCVRCGHCAWSCAERARRQPPRPPRRQGGDPLTCDAERRRAAGPASLLLPNTCQHCENAACMIDCPTGAIGRDPARRGLHPRGAVHRLRHLRQGVPVGQHPDGARDAPGSRTRRRGEVRPLPRLRGARVRRGVPDRGDPPARSARDVAEVARVLGGGAPPASAASAPARGRAGSPPLDHPGRRRRRPGAVGRGAGGAARPAPGCPARGPGLAAGIACALLLLLARQLRRCPSGWSRAATRSGKRSKRAALRDRSSAPRRPLAHAAAPRSRTSRSVSWSPAAALAHAGARAARLAGRRALARAPGRRAARRLRRPRLPLSCRAGSPASSGAARCPRTSRGERELLIARLYREASRHQRSGQGAGRARPASLCPRAPRRRRAGSPPAARLRRGGGAPAPPHRAALEGRGVDRQRGSTGSIRIAVELRALPAPPLAHRRAARAGCRCTSSRPRSSSALLALHVALAVIP